MTTYERDVRLYIGQLRLCDQQWIKDQNETKEREICKRGIVAEEKVVESKSERVEKPNRRSGQSGGTWERG
jgi:hypothetical protein